MKKNCCLYACFILILCTTSVFAQNVGVGTNTPGSKLEVQGETDDISTSALHITNQSGGSMIFSRNDGFTGIGKSDPWGTLPSQFQPLEVNGDVIIGGEAAADGDSEYLQILAQNEAWYFGVRNLLADNSRFFIGLDQNPRHFVVEPEGNVGIGYRNPGYRLDVRADSVNGDGIIQCANSDASHFMRVFSGRSGDPLPYLMWTRGNDMRFVAENANGTGFYEAARFHEDASGDYFLGIGTTAPTYRLEVIGDIRASGIVYCNVTPACSDKRFKRDIKQLADPLQILDEIRGVHYFWRKDEFPNKDFSERAQIGFISQELEEVLPELVYTDKDGYKWVDYEKITPVLLEAIKAQQKMIEKQQSEINSLKAESAGFHDLQVQINELKTLFGNIQP